MNEKLKQLIETDIAFSKMSVEHDAATAFAYYLTENSIQLPNNNNPIFGKKEIVEIMKKDEDIILSWQPKGGKISQSDDLGYTWGMYKVISRNDKGKVLATGKYLNIWVRQEDGSWKVEVDMGNNNP